MMMHNTLLHIARRRLLQVLARSLVLAAALNVMACSGGGSREMQRLLAEADSMNRNYVTFTTDTALLRAVRLADRHGTNTDRVRARYLLGCAYRDMGEAPQALDCFHQAVDLADTTNADSDHHLLLRVHSQIAYLFQMQWLPYDMLNEIDLALKDASLAHDKLSALILREKRAVAYEMLDDTDSVLSILTSVCKEYAALGMNDDAIKTLYAAAGVTARLGNVEKARAYLTDYEALPDAFDENGEARPYNNIYYYIKGDCFLQTHKLDSAEICFRKLQQRANNQNDVEAYCHGLYNLYKLHRQPDSIAKYADMGLRHKEILLHEDNTRRMQQMHSLYNYNRKEVLAAKKTAEAERARSWLLLSLSALCFVLAVGYHLHKTQRTKRQQMERQYQHDLEAMRQTQDELLALKEKDYEEIIRQRNSVISQLEEQVEKYNQAVAHQGKGEIEERLHSSAICKKLYQVATHPTSEDLTEADWMSLQQLINTVIPRFFGELTRNGYILSLEEYRLCMLIRLGFRNKEHLALMGILPSASSMIRKRLLHKVFLREGSAKDFDTLVREIT